MKKIIQGIKSKNILIFVSIILFATSVWGCNGATNGVASAPAPDTVVVYAITDNPLGKSFSGCCSSHGGLATAQGFNQSSRMICADNTLSPTCTRD